MAGRKNPKRLDVSLRLSTGVHADATYQLDPDGGLRLVRLVFTGDAVDSADLRAFPFSEALVGAQSAAPVFFPSDLPPFFTVGRPDGSDEWYAQFARALTFAKTHGHAKAPATFIAERNGIPVSTVHRWTERPGDAATCRPTREESEASENHRGQCLPTVRRRPMGGDLSRGRPPTRGVCPDKGESPQGARRENYPPPDRRPRHRLAGRFPRSTPNSGWLVP